MAQLKGRTVTESDLQVHIAIAEGNDFLSFH